MTGGILKKLENKRGEQREEDREERQKKKQPRVSKSEKEAARIWNPKGAIAAIRSRSFLPRFGPKKLGQVELQEATAVRRKGG